MQNPTLSLDSVESTLRYKEQEYLYYDEVLQNDITLRFDYANTESNVTALLGDTVLTTDTIELSRAGVFSFILANVSTLHTDELKAARNARTIAAQKELSAVNLKAKVSAYNKAQKVHAELHNAILAHLKSVDDIRFKNDGTLFKRDADAFKAVIQSVEKQYPEETVHMYAKLTQDIWRGAKVSGTVQVSYPVKRNSHSDDVYWVYSEANVWIQVSAIDDTEPIEPRSTTVKAVQTVQAKLAKIDAKIAALRDARSDVAKDIPTKFLK